MDLGFGFIDGIVEDCKGIVFEGGRIMFVVNNKFVGFSKVNDNGLFVGRLVFIIGFEFFNIVI